MSPILSLPLDHTREAFSLCNLIVFLYVVFRALIRTLLSS